MRCKSHLVLHSPTRLVILMFTINVAFPSLIFMLMSQVQQLDDATDGSKFNREIDMLARLKSQHIERLHEGSSSVAAKNKPLRSVNSFFIIGLVL